MAPVAKEFDKIIQDGRERKRNEALAGKIFSKNRRQSAPSKLKPGAGGGPSLASRVGVRKQHIPQRAISVGRRASVPSSGNVNGEWTHDLHHSVSTPAAKRAAAGGGLGARITQPGAVAGNKASPAAAGGSISKKAAKRRAKLAAAVGDAMDTDSDQANIVQHPPSAPAPAAVPQGLTIRGLAGPFALLGQNFAPGTTPADVESAMTPIGGEMVSCKVVKTQPLLIMEMVFASREGGERVIETFNNKTADGRVIKIYPKIGGYQQPTATNNNNAASSNGAPANAPTGPRSARNQVVDGTMGFGIEVTRNSGGGGNNGSGVGGLYSDKMISSGRRGGGRGGRGRGR